MSLFVAITFFSLTSFAYTKLLLHTSSDDITTCIRIIKEDYDLRTAITFGPREESYEINSAVNKLKIPRFSIGTDQKNGTWKPLKQTLGDKTIFLIHAVTLNDCLAALDSLGFWKERFRLVIFGNEEHFGNHQEILRDFYQNTRYNKSVHVALVVVREPQLKIVKVVSRNIFFNRTIVKTNCRLIVPDYYNDLKGYPIKVSYKKLTNRTQYIGTREEYLNGITLKTALEYLNAKLIMVEPLRRPPNGIMEDLLRDIKDGTSVTSLNERLLMYSDVVNKYGEKVEYTYPRVRESIVAFVPFNYAPNNFLRFHLWNRLSNLYATGTLMIIFYLISKFRKYRLLSDSDALLLSFALISGQGSSYRKTRSLGITFILILLTSSLINYALLALLPRDLTIAERPVAPLTIADITYKETYPIRLSNSYRELMSKVLDPDIYKVLNETRFNSTGVNSHFELHKDLETCQNQAYLLVNSFAVLAVRKNFLKNRMCGIVLTEVIMPAWNIYPFSYGSPLLGKINKILSRMSSAGLMVHFEQQFNLRIVKYYFHPRYYPLKVAFLKSALLVLLAGYLIAFMVFIMELLMFKLHHRAKRVQIR